MLNICLINGSLRGPRAASLEFLKDIELRLPETEFNKTRINLQARMPEPYGADILDRMAGADALILVFPLHNYGLPGALMRLLEDYYQYAREGHPVRAARVYLIVNCAFPRAGRVCGEAVRVVQHFCHRLGLNWRFAIGIGTGPVVVVTRKIPFLYPGLKRGYRDIAADIRQAGREPKNNYVIKPVIPEGIIAAIRRHYEKKGRMIEPPEPTTPNRN